MAYFDAKVIFMVLGASIKYNRLFRIDVYLLTLFHFVDLKNIIYRQNHYGGKSSFKNHCYTAQKNYMRT